MNAIESAAGLSLTDSDVASHPLDVLKIVDGGCFVSFIDKINETKAALAAGVPVEGKGALADLAVLTEEVNQILPLSVPGQVADENGQKTNALEMILACRPAAPIGAGLR